MKTDSSTAAFPLYQGTFSVGLDKKFNRIDREDPPSKGALKISLNPFLITARDKHILFDTGIGDFGEDTSSEDLPDMLDQFGLTNHDITDIFASHLHYDHIGGLAGQPSGHWELTFPDARVWVSRNDWESALSKDKYYDEEKTTFLHFLDANADIQLMDTIAEPYPEIRVREIGGHTEFSQALFYDDGDKKYMMAGDVLANRGEVNRTFAAKYDFDAQRSIDVRKELTQKAYEESYTVMGYHDSHHPLFKLTDYEEKQGYTITPVDADDPA